MGVWCGKIYSCAIDGWCRGLGRGSQNGFPLSDALSGIGEMIFLRGLAPPSF